MSIYMLYSSQEVKNNFRGNDGAMDAVVERGVAIETRLLPSEEFPLVYRMHGGDDRAIGPAGRTSVVRALGLRESSYDRILDFFHSGALDLEVLTRTWVALLLKVHPAILRVNGRLLLVGDGIKAP